MNSFFVALEVVFPLIVLIAIGYWAKMTKLVSKTSFSQINKLVFQLLIPASLMKSIIHTDFSTDFQYDMLIFAAGGVLILVGLLCLLVPIFEKDRKRIGSIVQACYRSNFVLFGLAIVINMYGADQTGVTSLLIAVVVPILNLLAVVVLQYYGMDKVDVKSVLLNILFNPMIVATLIGFVILFSHVSLPAFISKSIDSVANIATPVALLTLGGTFEWKSMKENGIQVAVIALLRLVVIPAAFVSVAVMLGFRQVELLSLLVLFGSPTAVSSYAMAIEMNCDEELASQSILVTTVCSLFSMIAWISVLVSMGLL